jgi:hypothetical protein
MSTYVPGDYNATCDVCGFEYKASKLRRRWDGFMVCDKDFETRHPQDLIKSPPAEKTPPWTRPESADSFIDYTDQYDGSDL